MSNGVYAVRLKAFVGRSFLPEDDSVWHEIRDILESFRPMGFQFEDAREAQPKPVSEKVREGIERNDTYIGILTRRGPIQPATPAMPIHRRLWAAVMGRTAVGRWSPPPWVVQESGYALGKGKQVLLLIEEGVDFPSSNLAADREWIAFKRGSIPECAPGLVAMIAHLIAGALPPVPAGLQVAPPEAPAALEEEAVEVPGTPSLEEIIAVLDEQQFQRADQLFRTFLDAHPESTLKRWFPYLYLRLKSIRGDSASLQKLKASTQEEPENVDAWMELGRYYASFKKHGAAAEILLQGARTVPDRERPVLVRQAAEYLAVEKEYDRALDTITELARTLTDSQQRKLSFVSLADIAKRREDKELEAAALERALDLDPGDLSVRFRLAFLYGETDKDRLAIYHYTLRLAQGSDAAALNNLGVAFAGLKLSGKEIDMYEQASGESGLARANLSHAYVDRGFLARAEGLANEVVGGEGEESERDRAISALNRITRMRSRENEIEEKIAADAREESAFRTRYAEAYVALPGRPITGVFETRHGRLTFSPEGNRLYGQGTFEDEESSTLGGIFMGLTGTAPAPSRVQTRSVKFEATIVGRAGRFTLKIERKQEGTILFALPERSTIGGLIILAEDGQSFDVLEEEKEKATIYRAINIDSEK